MGTEGPGDGVTEPTADDVKLFADLLYEKILFKKNIVE
jgi:hypothetical protein